MNDDKVLIEPTKATSNDSDNILKNIIKEIELTYGKGAVMKLGDKSHLKIEAVSTGSLVLDNAIGYDCPRIFLDQTYANQIMGYNLTSDEQTNTKAWFNDILDKFNKFWFKINPAFNSTFDFEGKTSIDVKTTTTSRFIYNLFLD